MLQYKAYNNTFEFAHKKHALGLPLCSSPSTQR